MTGTVIKSTGSWYNVRDESGKVYDCRIVGKFRLNDQELTNPVAVGDRVHFSLEDQMIHFIEPRINYVIRQSPRQKHYLHLIAANIDQAIIIVTLREPTLKPGFIDRYLMMTEPFNIPAIIIFNKLDIYHEDDLITLKYFNQVYRSIGHHTVNISTLTGEGLDEVKSIFESKTTLIGGQSGVGKSSLVSALFPNLNLKTSAISDKSGKGVHTTTFAEMYSLNENTHIIDTPGIKTLTFNYLNKTDVAHNFREFFILSENCKFGGDCLHRNEPGCAVLLALENGKVSTYRYQNYINLIDEIEAQNYWERKK